MNKIFRILVVFFVLTLVVGIGISVTGIDDCSSLEDMTLDGDYELTGNIDCGTIDNFDPVGDDTNPFAGTLDGQGFNITNLNINRPDENYIGLFGYTEQDSEIENLIIENIEIIGKDNVGGLVGYNDGEITNSSTEGTITGEDYTGGLTGYKRFGEIKNSHSTANITGGDYTGGLTGYNRNPITNSYATGLNEIAVMLLFILGLGYYINKN